MKMDGWNTSIISAKDDGVIRHVFDAGVLEHVLFENPVFEGRSIKHATQDEVSRRVGELLRSYDYAASMDFGAFDGSCTSEIRNLVENDIIVSLFSKVLGTENDKGLLYQAVHDRIKQKANVSVKSVLKAVIKDMIRESGDRGTSILDFMTNLVLFLANISMMLTKLGYKETEVKKMMWDKYMTLVRPRLSPSCHPASGSRCCLNCVPLCMKSTARKADGRYSGWNIQCQGCVQRAC